MSSNLNRSKALSHRCQKYVNARGEIIDPANQSGIGCPICNPPLCSFCDSRHSDSELAWHFTTPKGN